MKRCSNIIEVAPKSAFSNAIDNWSLKICNWQSSTWGSGMQLQMTNFQCPIVNQRFRTLMRSETGLVEMALEKPEVIFARAPGIFSDARKRTKVRTKKHKPNPSPGLTVPAFRTHDRIHSNSNDYHHALRRTPGRAVRIGSNRPFSAGCQ
jgi:hypothetical protein